MYPFVWKTFVHVVAVLMILSCLFLTHFLIFSVCLVLFRNHHHPRLLSSSFSSFFLLTDSLHFCVLFSIHSIFFSLRFEFSFSCVPLFHRLIVFVVFVVDILSVISNTVQFSLSLSSPYFRVLRITVAAAAALCRRCSSSSLSLVEKPVSAFNWMLYCVHT